MKRILVLILFIYSSNLVAENSYLVGFGSNDYGQLGIGTNHNLLNTNVPVQLGKDSNWVKVSFTDNFFIGLKEDGTIWVWGHSHIPTIKYYQPFQVGKDNDWIDVYVLKTSSGIAYFAIKKDGTLWSWGNNDNNNILGYENFVEEQKTPKQVGNDSDWRKISFYNFNDNYILGFKNNGKVYIWGGNIKFLEERHFKEIDTNINYPQVINDIDYAIDLKNAYYNSNEGVYYIKQDSTLWYYSRGKNYKIDTTKNYKEILYFNDKLFFKDANNNLYDENLQIFKSSFSEFTPIEKKTYEYEFKENHEYSIVFPIHSNNGGGLYKNGIIGLKKDNTLWGLGLNLYGELGSADYKSIYNVTELIPGTKWRSIFFEKYLKNQSPLIYAIKSDGTLWYWGEHNFSSNINEEVLVDNSSNWKEVQSGVNFTLGLKEDGSLWSWGNNRFGQLGQGDYKARFMPSQIGDDYNWSEIHVKGKYCLAIKQDSTLWMWGYPGSNESVSNFIIGNYYINKPILIDKLDDIYKLNSSDYFSGRLIFLYNESKPLIIYNYKDSLINNNYSIDGYDKIIKMNKFELKKYIFKDYFIKDFIPELSHRDFLFIDKDNKIFHLTDYSIDSTNSKYFELINYNENPRFKDYKFQLDDFKYLIHNYYRYFMYINNNGTLWGWGSGEGYRLTPELNVKYNSPIKLDSNNNWKELICPKYTPLLDYTPILINNENELYYWEYNENNENENKMLKKANDNDDYVKHFGNFALRTLKDTPKFSISGKVEDNSSGVSGIKVTCNCDTTTTDEYGNYSFTGLIQGEYSIKPITKCNSYNPENTDLYLSSNVSNINFELDKINNCYSVSGKVTYEDKPFYKQAISIDDTIVFTDEMGNYFVEYLKEGNYTILPILDSMLSTPENYKINLDNDKTDLDFVLKDIIYPEEENNYNIDFIIKPNPLENNDLKLEIISNFEEEKLLKIYLLDGNGRKKKLIFNNNISFGVNNVEISLNAFSEGIYFISFEFDDKKILKKIIK